MKFLIYAIIMQRTPAREEYHAKKDIRQSAEMERKQLAQQTHIAYVLHTGDWKENDGIVYLPLYMAALL